MAKRPLKILAVLVASALVASACTSEPDSSDPAPQDTGSDDQGTNNQTRVPPNNSKTSKLDPEKTAYRQSKLTGFTTREAAPTCEGLSDGQLSIGGLLPLTGKLKYLGLTEEAAIQLALQDINDSGGVLDNEVIYDSGDSKSNIEEAELVVTRHIRKKVDVVIGPSSSNIAARTIPKMGKACKLQISPATTSPELSSTDLGELFFRTSPSDSLQGQAIAELVIENGSSNVSIIAIDDPYGRSLLNFIDQSLKRKKVNETTKSLYEPDSFNPNELADIATKNQPDAIIIVGYEESAQFLPELFERGIETDQIFLSDGNAGNALGERFFGELSGVRGVLPGAEVTPEFADRMREVNSELEDLMFGPETYDAMIIAALAAELAGSDSPPEIAKQVNGVTRDGDKCTSFSECKTLIEQGKTNIDYDGQSGPQEFSKEGEPTEPWFSVVQFG